MTHRGIRSIPKQIERAVNHYIFTVSFQDKRLAEVVCRCDVHDIKTYLYSSYTFEQISKTFIPEIEHGEVLLDSRGNYYLQRLLEGGESHV